MAFDQVNCSIVESHRWAPPPLLAVMYTRFLLLMCCLHIGEQVDEYMPVVLRKEDKKSLQDKANKETLRKIP